jgi:hypothetical protein
MECRMLPVRRIDDLPTDLSPPPAARAASDPLPATCDVTDWRLFVHERVAAGSDALYAEAIDLLERQVVSRVLAHTRGNQARAARILGITRGNLRKKIRLLGIELRGAATAVPAPRIAAHVAVAAPPVTPLCVNNAPAPANAAYSIPAHSTPISTP